MKLVETERYFIGGIKVWKKLAQKWNILKRQQMLRVQTTLTTLTFLTRANSTATMASSICVPIEIVLGEAGSLSSFAATVTLKASKMFTAKHKKHYSIKPLAQSKLDSIGYIF